VTLPSTRIRPALTVNLDAREFPAVSAEPVKQFQHRRIAVGVTLAKTLPDTQQSAVPPAWHGRVRPMLPKRPESDPPPRRRQASPLWVANFIHLG
jgi:hypothetical protein